jgi:DNA repair exonuclease SbcCD nuclease subunit
MRFLHLADLHLDSPLRGLARAGDAIRSGPGITREALAAAIGYALERHVDLVAIVGDVYDRDWQDFSTGVFFASQLRRLREEKIPVVVIHGNHDSQSQITRRLTLPDNVRVLSSKTPETLIFSELGLAVHGQSYAQRAVTENLVASYPAPIPGLVNVGLLHSGLGGGSGHDTYAPTALTDLQRCGYDYWALGHIHVRGPVGGLANVCYAGVIQGRSVRETGAHGGLLVTAEPGVEPVVEPVDFDVMRWALVDVDCSGAASWNDVLERSQPALEAAIGAAAGRPLAARVSLRGATALHDELLANGERVHSELEGVADAAASAGLWLERVTVDTSPPLGAMHADSELDQVLSATAGLAETTGALDEVLSELHRRVSAELGVRHDLSDELKPGPELRKRVLALGLARLRRELGLEPAPEE